MAHEMHEGDEHRDPRRGERRPHQPEGPRARSLPDRPRLGPLPAYRRQHAEGNARALRAGADLVDSLAAPAWSAAEAATA